MTPIANCLKPYYNKNNTPAYTCRACESTHFLSHDKTQCIEITDNNDKNDKCTGYEAKDESNTSIKCILCEDNFIPLTSGTSSNGY